LKKDYERKYKEIFEAGEATEKEQRATAVKS
jgi:hypothetical protein